MSDPLELDGKDTGVEPGTSQVGEPSTAATPEPTRQPKVNLDDLEEFRKFKSSSQRREQQAAQQAQAERQAREQLEARLRRIEMEGMDEVTRVKYERDEAYRARQSYEQDRQRREVAYEWDRIVQGISAETGVPTELLHEQADTSDQAWRIARKWERDNAGKKAGGKSDDESNVDDRVVVGGGKPTAAASRYQQEWSAAKANNDLHGMLAAEEKAYKAGVEIKKPQRR